MDSGCDDEFDLLEYQKFIQKIFPSKSGKERVKQLNNLDKLIKKGKRKKEDSDSIEIEYETSEESDEDEEDEEEQNIKKSKHKKKIRKKI